MDTTDREAIRQHLLTQQAQLTAQLPSLKSGAQPVPPDAALGRLTRLDAMQSQEISRSKLAQVKAQLASLERVLTQVDDEDFGLCAECYEPIPLGRLRAMPGATHCVNCA